MKKSELEPFQLHVWEYYDSHGRHDLPWRKPEADGTFDPYKIMISEIMLQQTQVARVIPKYHAFIETFPTVTDLANADLSDVLRAWQGLGYNRRAKFLWQAAQQITEVHQSKVPNKEADLVALPGIGKNTAGAIMAYAFNQPCAYIETNIRTVYIHHFFNDKFDIHDKDILEIVEASLPKDRSLTRAWYWALMDYGAYIKAAYGNLNMNSKHYVKQSKFHGSKRQLRGAILRLLQNTQLSFSELLETLEDERLSNILDELVAEQMIKRDRDVYSL